MRTASRVLKSAHSARQLPASLTPRSSLRPFRSLSGLAHSSRPSIRPCTTPIALTLPRQLLSTTSPLRNESKPKEELKDEPKQEEIELEHEIDEDLSERKWSTPLAKTIAEAIEVPPSPPSHPPQPLNSRTNPSPGHRPDPPRQLHAHVPDGRPRGLLHWRPPRL